MLNERTPRTVSPSLGRYQQGRATRYENETLVGTTRGGKLAPIKVVPVEGSEAGLIRQAVTMELDPVAGRLITQVTAHVVSVFVPMQAIHALKDPTADYPGNTEVIRELLLSGNPLFDLEEEGEITKRLGVEPSSINGTKMVSEDVRIGCNAAVNHLRQRKYVKAAQLLASNTAITPALLSQTVLDRLNGVLDPEDRVNGQVDFQLPNVQLPAKGIGVYKDGTSGAPYWTSSGEIKGADGENYTATAAEKWSHPTTDGVMLQKDPNQNNPYVYVELEGSTSVSLTEFYTAERMDRYTREMRKIVDDNPQYGEEMVTRWVHGLSVDMGKQPVVVYDQEHAFRMGIEKATDKAGIENETQTTQLVAQQVINLVIPKTELGGNIYTFISVKPDETLANQPHPIFSKPRGARNHLADEMAIDPVPVTIRELDADCDQADEETVALYVGNNHLLKSYVNYGFNRHIDPTTVENKTALWQVEVPMSVTPETVLYPDDLDHYPFADNLAEVCTYTIESAAQLQTPIVFGPAPVEELAQIETDDLFEDA